MTQPTPTNLPTDNDLLCLCTIMQGLLASGHYTECTEARYVGTDDIEEAGAHPKKWDAGKDWKEEGFTRRRHSFAADDALALFRELQEKRSELNQQP